MTDFEKDSLKICLGAGDEVIARRKQVIDGFVIEHGKCLNPYRKGLLCSEIKRLRRELEALENLQQHHPPPIALS